MLIGQINISKWLRQCVRYFQLCPIEEQIIFRKALSLKILNLDERQKIKTPMM